MTTRTPREQRLDEVIAAYIEAGEQRTQRLKDWFARYPEFEPELKAFAAEDEQLRSLFDGAITPVSDDPPDFGSDYDRIEFIGAGGMGTVYRAHQKSLDRTVVLKTINTELYASGQERTRFRREAQVAAKLKHINIVTVYGIHEIDDRYFISMEYVEGESLRDAILRDGALSPVRAANLLYEVALAIQIAHDSKVLHRDLKPSNILIDSSGRPKIIDFGLAKFAGYDTQLTLPGDVLGAPIYMPPEQARGGTVNERSDVYSLGATLYEAITGVSPFHGQTPQEILHLVQYSEPDQPRLINPQIPEDLETICLRCLAKDPRERYGSARELAEDLQTFIDGGSIRPIGWFEQIRRTVRHRVSLTAIGLIAGPAAGLLLMLASSLGIFGLQSGAGLYVVAVAAWMLIWWITEAVPAAATAFLPLVLFPLLGIMPADEVAKSYVEDDLFLFLGGMLIALGLEDSGLSRRFALKIMMWFGRNPKTVVLALMYATAFLSMWLSNTASTLVMLPVAFGLVLQMESESSPEDTKNLRKAVMLGIAYAATAGGLGTPVGTPANQQLLLVLPVSFLRWVALGLPCAIVLTSAAWYLLVNHAFPLSTKQSFAGEKRVAGDIEKIGPISTRERRMLIVGIVTAMLWILRTPMTQLLPGDLGYVKDGTIAMVMALVCFIVPTGKQREYLLDARVISRVPWSVWLLFGGGLALAGGITTSGLGRDLGLKLAGTISGLPPFRILGAIVSAGAAALLTQLTSNLSTAKILIPVLKTGTQGLAQDLQTMLLFAATLGVSCDFMFPFSTPPNAIVFGAGKLTVRDMMKAGFWLTLIGVAVIAVSVSWLLRGV